MTLNPLKLGFTPAEFTDYITKMKPVKFTNGNAIQGVVLHNTWAPTLKNVQGYLDSKRWKPEQLIDNWWVSYRKMKWAAGPHIFIFPHKIYVATPLNTAGTHTPSWNKTHWGVEVIGNYDIEKLPDAMRQMTVHTIAQMLKVLGKPATATTLKLHGEDPKTSHKDCPGKDMRPKDKWLTEITADMAKESH